MSIQLSGYLGEECSRSRKQKTETKTGISCGVKKEGQRARKARGGKQEQC